MVYTDDDDDRASVLHDEYLEDFEPYGDCEDDDEDAWLEEIVDGDDY